MSHTCAHVIQSLVETVYNTQHTQGWHHLYQQTNTVLQSQEQGEARQAVQDNKLA